MIVARIKVESRPDPRIIANPGSDCFAILIRATTIYATSPEIIPYSQNINTINMLIIRRDGRGVIILLQLTNTLVNRFSENSEILYLAFLITFFFDLIA